MTWEILTHIDGDDSTCQIEIDLTKFNGKVLNIRYDGEMNNLPGYFDRGQDTFYRLINPKDGAIFTDMADDKTYKYKALGIDEVFVPQDASDCDAGVKFTSIPTGFAQLICRHILIQQNQGHLRFGIPNQLLQVVFWRVMLKPIVINF